MGRRGKESYEIDATDEMVLSEATRASYQRGMGGDLDDGLYEEFARLMQYPKLADKDRVKVFEFDRNDDAIEKVRQRVKMCRRYLKTLQP